MLKPIVSMNQMAMNESIATTCCYVWNGTSLLGSASLPHGGQLKANNSTKAYVQLGDTRYALNSTWYGYTGGHVNDPYAASCVVTSDMNGVPGYHDHQTSNSFVSMEYAQSKNWVTKGYYDHKNPATCPYFKETTFAKSFTHTGATSGHYTWTGGNSWLADHTAVQYSS